MSERSSSSNLSFEEGYAVACGVAGSLSGLVTLFATFIGAYAYCVMTYGFLWGLGFGWLPSAILAVGLAVIVAWVMAYVWPLVLGVALLVAWANFPTAFGWALIILGAGVLFGWMRGAYD